MVLQDQIWRPLKYNILQFMMNKGKIKFEPTENLVIHIKYMQ